MNLRLANMDDLLQLKEVYKKIIRNMNEQGIEIWDEIYPCEIFPEDIEKNRLYILLKEKEIVAAFALNDSNPAENYVKWENSKGKAIYIERLGVNVNYLQQGIGSAAVGEIIALARELGAEYVRLFVVDINVPAIKFYEKNGFRQVAGSYEEKIDDDFVLHEYGFEIKISR